MVYDRSRRPARTQTHEQPGDDDAQNAAALTRVFAKQSATVKQILSLLKATADNGDRGKSAQAKRFLALVEGRQFQVRAGGRLHSTDPGDRPHFTVRLVGGGDCAGFRDKFHIYVLRCGKMVGGRRDSFAFDGAHLALDTITGEAAAGCFVRV